MIFLPSLTQNQIDLYPELNLINLQSLAAGWADSYPAILEINLYRTTIDIRSDDLNPQYDYVLMATVIDKPKFNPKYITIPKIPKNDPKYREKIKKEEAINQAKLEKKGLWDSYCEYQGYLNYFDWAWEDCSHIEKELETIFKAQPDTSSIEKDTPAKEKWIWYTKDVREELNDDLVNPFSEIILVENYDQDHSIDKPGRAQNGKLFPTDLAQEIKNEVEPIYNAIVALVGIKSSSSDERKNAALKAFGATGKQYKHLRKNYFYDTDLFEFNSSQAKRDFCGKLIQIILAEKGCGLFGPRWIFKELKNHNR